MIGKIKSRIGKRGILGALMVLGSVLGYNDAAKDAKKTVLGEGTQDQYGNIRATSGTGGWNAIDNLQTISAMEKENRKDAIVGGFFGLVLLLWGRGKYRPGKFVAVPLVATSAKEDRT